MVVCHGVQAITDTHGGGTLTCHICNNSSGHADDCPYRFPEESANRVLWGAGFVLAAKAAAFGEVAVPQLGVRNKGALLSGFLRGAASPLTPLDSIKLTKKPGKAAWCRHCGHLNGRHTPACATRSTGPARPASPASKTMNPFNVFVANNQEYTESPQPPRGTCDELDFS